MNLNIFENRRQQSEWANRIKFDLVIFLECKHYCNVYATKSKINDLYQSMFVDSVDSLNEDICFIDYEYASLNNIHCDLARVIEEFGLNNLQAEHLIDCYGYRDKINFIQKIDIWKNINTYLDYIWILIMQKKGFISPKSEQYLQNLEKIKLLKQ